jgi:hypothetical protein
MTKRKGRRRRPGAAGVGSCREAENQPIGRKQPHDPHQALRSCSHGPRCGHGQGGKNHDGKGQQGHFRKGDKNGDGFLTKDEVGDKRWSRIQVADANKDGKVSQAELQQARKDGKLRGPHPKA